MTTGSTLVAFKKALVAALQSRPGLDGVRVTYEFTQDYVADKAIWLEGARSADRIPTMKPGTKRVEENYTLTLVIQVLASEGESQEAADEYALVLLSEVQQCLAENPQLIPEIMWATVDGWEHRIGQLPKGDGHGSGFNVRINVRARLYP